MFAQSYKKLKYGILFYSFSWLISSYHPPFLRFISSVIHTQNITSETPGLFVDVLSLKCLQNKQNRCVWVLVSFYYIFPCIFFSKFDKRHLAVCSSSAFPYSCFGRNSPPPLYISPSSLLTAPPDKWSPIDGFIFVALCWGSGAAVRERSCGERRLRPQQIPTRGVKDRRRKTFFILKWHQKYINLTKPIRQVWKETRNTSRQKQ